ncbi:MAG: hypothetical protein A2939_00265 [Parcubacteria group bacterium RIFCSPLOWO2_01_FULL_48_18]|nr:MAG: hypothetical protein A2939_00265 [Parcubacteria group bacterium RIFCSPLOWO2_01_FULL_48_18]
MVKKKLKPGVEICPLCDLKKTRFFMRENNYILFKCRVCHFAFRKDRISEIEEGFSFQNEVRSAYQAIDKSIDEINQRLALRIINFLKQYGLRGGSVMEVGCGSASIGKVIQRSFPELAYIGIEPSGYFPSVEKNPELTILSTAKIDDHIAPESQDALIFNHVLEHVPDPRSMVPYYLRFLKPGGLVYVEVPNEQWKKIITPLMRFVRGTSSGMFAGHINFFTQKSLHVFVSAFGLEMRGGGL